MSQGIWYTQDYYKAICHHEKLDRAQWLTANNYQHFRYAHLSSNLFTRLPERLDLACAFKIKQTASPSEGLDSIHESFNLLDSNSVCSLAFWDSLKIFLGDEKFNVIVNVPNNSFYFSSESNATFFFSSKDIACVNELKIGDKCYFPNLTTYSCKHPLGEAQEIFVLYTGEAAKPFVGFGLPPEGVTIEEIEKKFFDAYNIPPVLRPEDQPKIYDKTWDKTVDWLWFQNRRRFTTFKQDGKLGLRVVRPNIEFIEQLQSLSLEEVQKMASIMPLSNFEQPPKKK